MSGEPAERNEDMSAEMIVLNRHAARREPLHEEDARALGVAGAKEPERYLSTREGYRPTPLVALPALAATLGLKSLHVKDEGQRLGLGSFKALGGGYAVARLALEEASRRSGAALKIEDWRKPEVRAVAATMTFACATDGNHGRSVAQGAALVGARSVVFIHAGVSEARGAAIARFGALVRRVEGNYDDSVAEAAQAASENGWTLVSDTASEGDARVPLIVMQGYTAIAREVLAALVEPPTHVFVQAGVGGLAAALAAHFAIALGPRRPRLVVVEPSRAACVLEAARAGRVVKIAEGQPTVMAMLECFEASYVALRVLLRAADAFMTVEDEEAIAAMNRLARPLAGDPLIVSGESGAVGLAGLVRAVDDRALELDKTSRVLLINTEGATDPEAYARLTGTG